MIGCLFGLHQLREIERGEMLGDYATHVCRACRLVFNDVDGRYVLWTRLSPSETRASYEAFRAARPLPPPKCVLCRTINVREVTGICWRCAEAHPGAHYDACLDEVRDAHGTRIHPPGAQP